MAATTLDGRSSEVASSVAFDDGSSFIGPKCTIVKCIKYGQMKCVLSVNSYEFLRKPMSTKDEKGEEGDNKLGNHDSMDTLI